MTDEILFSNLRKIVTDTMEKNNQVIFDYLFSTLSDATERETRLFLTALSLSATLGAQVAIRFLSELGEISLSEELSPALTVLPKAPHEEQP